MPIAIRPATMDDFAFIDALQGKYNKQIGWMPKTQLEGKIRAGHVLVAESALDEPRASASGSDSGPGPLPHGRGSLPEPAGPLPHGRGSLPEGRAPLGFVIGNDQYFKRDDCGIIYQLCVAPSARRSLIGAMLVKAMFDRAAYGCRLFCCWCAQDLEANRFWESLGFVPLAYRVGSEKKGRVHIFWQKRIRAGDETTPWWFPAKTDAGSMREDRLVLPIPPNMHWSDELPVLSPQAQSAPPERKSLPAPSVQAPQEKPARRPRAHIQFGLPTASPSQPVETVTPGQKKPRPKRKADPRLISAARELRDRWLEKIDDNPGLLEPQGKYELAKAPEPEPLPHGRGAGGALPEAIEVKALPEAA